MKPTSIELWYAGHVWRWHARSRNGRVLAFGGTYDRRGTAIRYMEIVVAAKARRIPVFATGENGLRKQLY